MPDDGAGGCSSGKRQHASRDAATQHGQFAARTFDQPMRVYRCPECGLWHLTKRKPRGRFAVGRRSTSEGRVA